MSRTTGKRARLLRQKKHRPNETTANVHTPKDERRKKQQTAVGPLKRFKFRKGDDVGPPMPVGPLKGQPIRAIRYYAEYREELLRGSELYDYPELAEWVRTGCPLDAIPQQLRKRDDVELDREFAALVAAS